ncbi:MAG: hypothetical protein H0U48_03555 [Euzebyaceae bacterium]|nr:hypothetical protein [Euzebyaceae bacterium]
MTACGQLRAQPADVFGPLGEHKAVPAPRERVGDVIADCGAAVGAAATISFLGAS